MTEDQKKIKRYVNQLERRLRLPLELKVRINGDIGTEIHQRMESGQTVDQVFQEMGSPDEVAASFNREFSEFEIRKNPIRFLFLIMVVMAAAGELWYIGALLQMQNMAESLNRIFLNPAEFGRGSVIAVCGFIAGCIAAYFIALYGRKETYVKYRKCIILSAVGFIAGMTAAILPESTGALQWKIPFGMSDLVVEPGMIINIAVLIMSVKYFYTQKERKILDK